MLKKLKLLLGIAESDRDELLQYMLDTITDEILNYCNLDSLPVKLENIAVRMAADMWRNEGYGMEAKQQAVTSVSRGNVSTSFAIPDQSGLAGGKSIVDDYAAQLNAFRRLRW